MWLKIFLIRNFNFGWSKIEKKYDSAKTPFQRILLSEHICKEKKDLLTVEYKTLDPVDLLAQLETLQDTLWNYSWNKSGHAEHSFVVTKKDIIDQNKAQAEEAVNPNRFYRSSKKIDLRSAPRTYRTRPDPFENCWDEIRLRLELMPETTAVELIRWLMGKYQGKYSVGQTRTLQRRIAQWRQEQESQEKKLRTLMIE